MYEYIYISIIVVIVVAYKIYSSEIFKMYAFMYVCSR